MTLDQVGAHLAAPGDRRSDRVRVMIVDDSLTVRTVLTRLVETGEGLAVVATASSAERAIAQLETTRIDVMLLDLAMPGMGGLEALPRILSVARGTQVLVVSSLTQDGAEHSISALSMGAADTMLKPPPGGFTDTYRAQLLRKIRALGTNGGDPSEAAAALNANAIVPTGAQARKNGPRLLGKTPELIAIGASTGGIHALNILLKELDPSFDLTILITQHLPPSFIPVFARQIELACSRQTVIAHEGATIAAGKVMIASGTAHMAVKRVGDRLVVRNSGEPASSGCLPSVDPMFASCASECEGRVLAVVLSGMGRDGAEGAKAVVDAGGTVFAQDAETSAVWGMPGVVAKAGLASLVASPRELALAVLAQSGAEQRSPLRRALAR